MPNRTAKLKSQDLQEQLSLIREIYEEMINNHKDLDQTEPVLFQIKHLEKKISNFSSSAD